MFKFLKKLFGGNNKVPVEKNNAPQNKKKSAQKKRNNNHPTKNNSSPAPKKKTKKPRDKKSIIPEIPKIEKPAELIEIPVAEGKKRFCDYNLSRDILLALQCMKFEYCTQIQELTLQHLLDGKDLAGKAQTGTGKTAAFLIAAFNHILNNPLENQQNGCPRCLILAPTRELAMQIHKDAQNIGIFTGLRSVVVFGGMDHAKQRFALDDKVDILIGTPGRIIDYSNTHSLNLSKVEILVIDEADRMLDMGFIPDVRRIVVRLPHKEKRQTMFFSATLDNHILSLASDWLRDPIMLESEPDKLVGELIKQSFYTVAGNEKLAVLLHIINNYKYDRMLIFGNRKDVNLRLERDLAKYGVKIMLLSGDVPQEKRIRILEKFRSGEGKILLATDVAARGIHVDNVSLVVNYDLPERPDDYVHRIGRTGRAGKEGEAISFICEYGAYNLEPIEKLLNTRFPSTLPPEEMLILPPRVDKKG